MVAWGEKADSSRQFHHRGNPGEDKIMVCRHVSSWYQKCQESDKLVEILFSIEMRRSSALL
jgi:hypothetical protein